MEYAVATFRSELEKLEGFLSASEAEEEIVSSLIKITPLPPAIDHTSLDAIRRNATNKRRHTYVAAIIVMYGALERFVDDVIAEFLQNCVRASTEYDRLPEAVRKRHTNLTIDYLALIRDGRVREPDDIEAVVSNLLGCIRGESPFMLNSRAFTLRSANMNLDRIRGIFGNVGVELPNRKLANTKSYSTYLEENEGRQSTDIDGSELESLFGHVNDLVTRRNDIAHGVSSLDDIEELSIVIERANRLQAFVQALHECLQEGLIKHHIDLGLSTSIEGDVAIFNNSIICFELPGGSVSKDDFLIMRSPKNGEISRFGRILSIQVDGENQENVVGEPGKMIGVKVDFRAKSKKTFCLLPSSALE